MKLISNAVFLGTLLTVTVAWADSDQQAVQDAVNSLQAAIQARQAQLANGQEPTGTDLQAMKAEVQDIRAEIATVQAAACPATCNSGGIPVVDANRTSNESSVQSLQTTIQARQSQIAASPEPTALQLQQMKDEVEAARSEFR